MDMDIDGADGVAASGLAAGSVGDGAVEDGQSSAAHGDSRPKKRQRREEGGGAGGDPGEGQVLSVKDRPAPGDPPDRHDGGAVRRGERVGEDAPRLEATDRHGRLPPGGPAEHGSLSIEKPLVPRHVPRRGARGIDHDRQRSLAGGRHVPGPVSAVELGGVGVGVEEPLVLAGVARLDLQHPAPFVGGLADRLEG